MKAELKSVTRGNITLQSRAYENRMEITSICTEDRFVDMKFQKTMSVYINNIVLRQNVFDTLTIMAII